MSAPPVLSLGFRVFFLLGVAHAAAAVAIWVGTLEGAAGLALCGLPPMAWHAHEMVFGFAQAVIAGFLLTAVRSWTGQPTPTGWPLGALALLWLLPRLVITLGDASWLGIAAGLDLLFGTLFFTAVARPVIVARQARQVGILAKLALLAVADAAFYGAALGWIVAPTKLATDTGVYLVLGLILTISRRVVGFFVRAAFPGTPPPPERPWLDRAALVVFIALFALDVFTEQVGLTAGAAGVLAALHAVRLWSWWTPAAFGRSLLWVLFVGYGWIVAGFALMAAAPALGVPAALPLHALTVGGIGVTVLGMVARVSLGHTGRDVRGPRPFLGGVFGLGVLATAARVLGPWLAPAWTATSWRVAGTLWILAFSLLFVWALPLWLRPRPDGQPG